MIAKTTPRATAALLNRLILKTSDGRSKRVVGIEKRRGRVAGESLSRTNTRPIGPRAWTEIRSRSGVNVNSKFRFDRRVFRRVYRWRRWSASLRKFRFSTDGYRSRRGVPDKARGSGNRYSENPKNSGKNAKKGDLFSFRFLVSAERTSFAPGALRVWTG